MKVAAACGSISRLPASPVRRLAWRRTSHISTDRVAVIDAVPTDEVVSDWSELVTLSSEFVGAAVDLEQLATGTAEYLNLRAGNGDLQFSLLDSRGDDLTYVWALTGNALVEDQFGVARLHQQGGAVYTIRYDARTAVSPEALRLAVDLVGGVTELPPIGAGVIDRESVEPAVGADLDALLASLRAPLGPLDQVVPRQYYRDVISRVDRSTDPDLWASISALVGMQLLRSKWLDPEESARTATVALRRSLEVLDPSSEVRAHVIGSLANAYVSLANLGDASAPAFAEFTLAVARASYGRPDQSVDAAHVADDLSRLRLITRAEAAQLQEAIDQLQPAIDTFWQAGERKSWAQSQIRLGDLYSALGDRTDEATTASLARTAARDAWRTALKRLTTDPSFALDRDDATNLITTAVGRLNHLDRAGIPEPTVTQRHTGKQRGRLLFLRPLESAGRLRIASRFRHPEKLAVQFEVEPDPISVEGALYRVLGPWYDFSSIGGSSDGFGASRLYSAGGKGWQSVFHALLSITSVVVIIPQSSEGVRWELETLRSSNVLDRCLFVFPPVSPDVDTAALVAGGAEILTELGIESPAYDPAGRLFAVHPDGALAVVYEFGEVWDDTLPDRLMTHWPPVDRSRLTSPRAPGDHGG